MNQIGFHFVDNQYTDAQVNAHFGLLNDCKPACINVLGGAQYKEALSFAKRAKQAFPEMRVIFRHYRDGGDDGMHTRLSARDWWDKIGKLYIGTGLTILSDNESMAADLRPYAAWQAEIMRYAGDAGVGIAYNRFATHNPSKAQFGQLNAAYIAAADYDLGLHTCSPNVYFTPGNYDGLKYPGYHAEQGYVLGLRLSLTIGEFAILRDIRDAHHGWHSMTMDGAFYANRLITLAKDALPGIPVCVYSIGQWPINADTFSLDKSVIDVIQKYPMPLTLPIPTPPIPDPPEPPPAQSRYVTIERAEHIRLMQREKDYAALRGIMDAMIEQYEQHKEGE